MIAIQKNKPPKDLTSFVNQNREPLSNGKCLYEKFKDECRSGYNELKRALLKEQHSVCCYCMRKIGVASSKGPKMKLYDVTIEHFKPQSRYKELCLEYSNLLACCRGREGMVTFCGQKKGNCELEFVPNPADPKGNQFFNEAIIYTDKGEIFVCKDFFSSVDDFKKALDDLHDRLNLNNEILVRARRIKYLSMINKYENWLSKRKNKKNNSKSYFIHHYIKKNNCIDFLGFVLFQFTKKTVIHE